MSNSITNIAFEWFLLIDCEELISSLDPNCDLVELESQVKSAKQAEAALQRIAWEKIFSHKTAILKLVSSPLLQVKKQSRVNNHPYHSLG